MTASDRYEFEFEPAFRLAGLPFGITPRTTGLEVREDHIDIRFGPWRVHVERRDIDDVAISGPYQVAKVIGPARLSFADRGLTFATNSKRGVCLRLRHPVRGIDPLGVLRHPGVTVTVADPERLFEQLSPATA